MIVPSKPLEIQESKLKKFLVGLVILAAVLFAATSVNAAPPSGMHCPEGWITKDESGADDNNIVIEAGTLICVKSSTENTGILTADGETTLQEYLFNAGIVDGSGAAGRDVSYFVTYAPTETNEPTVPPTIEPTIAPTIEPTLPPVDPTPEPTVEVTPEPTVDVTPDPTPNPTLPASDTESVSNKGTVPASWAFLIALAMVSGLGVLMAKKVR